MKKGFTLQLVGIVEGTLFNEIRNVYLMQPIYEQRINRAICDVEGTSTLPRCRECPAHCKSCTIAGCGACAWLFT